MNFRNRYLLITIRTLFGLMMIFSGVMGFLAGSSMEGVPPDMIPTMQTLWDTGIFQMIKVTEIVAGLMFVTGFLPALAAIFVAPIAVGIIVVTSRIAPSNVISGVIVCLLNAYLGYAYWDKYKALFKR
jgi:uncharacterized membrane protein YphA (DoxX/SURF4 family)